MTENGCVDAAKAATLAQGIVKMLIDEDSAVRRRAVNAAMTLLGEEFDAGSRSGASHTEDSVEDLAEFFNRDGKLNPSTSAYLCAAYHFSKNGSSAFSLEDLRSIAADAGVVLPDRLDMTLKQASKDGKRLFQSAGRNAYRPTATAGVYFRETWNVRPGKKSKLDELTSE
jgi:hypothetical protein